MLCIVQTVVETPSYLASAKAAGISDGLRMEIVNLVANDPMIGDALVGTGGCRKFRVAGRGHGKSGGFRVVHFHSGPDIPIFLLAAFGKGEKANVTKAEAAELAKLTARLVEAHRSKRSRTGSS